MRYFSLTLIALATFIMAVPAPADAISVRIGRGGISVGSGYGGYYYPPGYVNPRCYYDYWGRLICPRRRIYAPPPIVVYPHKKKWRKKKWRRRRR